MTPLIPPSSLELRSLVTEQGTLQLSLIDVPVPTPAAGQVLVRVEAAPINPSDLGLLFAGADMNAATIEGTPDHPIVITPVTDGALRALAARVGRSLPVGNEGAGTVVATGDSREAQALQGRTVSVAAGGMYTQYRTCEAAACLVLPEGTPARTGASSFVNPLTALGMIETMRREDHSGLVHTAAASNLGQMLVKLCLEEEIPLVNIVRRPEQVALLRSIGAVHVCDSSASSFKRDLKDAITATSATLAFDATGGGKLVSQILTAMEGGHPTHLGVLEVWIDRSQAGVHLRRPRPEPDNLDEDFWLRLERRRVVAHPVSSKHRSRTIRSAPRGGSGGIGDDLLEHLLERDLARRDPRSQRVLSVHQAVHR